MTVPPPGAPPGTPVAVVTGATSGIGRFVALGLARAGHHLVLPVRNAERGRHATEWLRARHPDASLETVEADLSSLAATRHAARAIRARHQAVALLVNNAGVFRARREQTGEGHDVVLATNLLSPHLLTRELLPALLAGAPSRIVTVGSSTSDRARIDPARLALGSRWTMTAAYAQSKLGVMMSTFETARRLEGTGVVANVVHPGMVATGLVRSGGPIGLVWRALALVVRTDEQGAETPLHVALDPDLARTTGRYFKDRAPAAPNKRALDPALRRQLWDELERLTGEAGPTTASATSAR